jgi:hypothetical protein
MPNTTFPNTTGGSSVGRALRSQCRGRSSVQPLTYISTNWSRRLPCRPWPPQSLQPDAWKGQLRERDNGIQKVRGSALNTMVATDLWWDSIPNSSIPNLGADGRTPSCCDEGLPTANIQSGIAAGKIGDFRENQDYRRFFAAASSLANFASASRLGIPRRATNRASWAFRGRAFFCSQWRSVSTDTSSSFA